MSDQGLQVICLTSELIHTCDDGTRVSGFAPGARMELPMDHTHMGLVVTGEAVVSHGTRQRHLCEGDFFSVTGLATIAASGGGIVISVSGYSGFSLFGGPIEEVGKLRYIDGCTDTVLVPPVRKGDPCLNHLHFPPHTVQTLHTHPSVRVNVVYRGEGICCVPPEGGGEVSLVPGSAFILKAQTVHGFKTGEGGMDVITFHPDSDVGMTDDDHPMLNRTMVGRVSARDLPDIRTGGRR